eukprot:scaffold22078_cov33-Tisochrysis_lutea.AAC.9
MALLAPCSFKAFAESTCLPLRATRCTFTEGPSSTLAPLARNSEATAAPYSHARAVSHVAPKASMHLMWSEREQAAVRRADGCSCLQESDKSNQDQSNIAVKGMRLQPTCVATAISLKATKVGAFPAERLRAT